jgi:hypothetical protein
VRVVIALWLTESSERLEADDVARLREELQRTLGRFARVDDEELLESSRPLLELLELGLPLERRLVHVLLAELMMNLSAAFYRIAKSLRGGGHDDSADVAIDLAVQLIGIATLHASRGSGAEESWA